MTTYGPYSFPNGSTGDAANFTYDSPTQTAATTTAVAGTARAICHDTDGGNSTNVGPTQGQEGAAGGYFYTEASSPNVNGDVYTMEFETVLDASVEQWQFNFYTCQRGPAIGNNQSLCSVEIEENNSGTWIDVSGELGGSGNDTTNGAAWTSQSIDLSDGGIYEHATTRVRIRIESQALTAWHGDYGIDTVEIVGTPIANREQDKFRFYDDGTESGSVAEAAQDTDINRSLEDPFQLRIGMQATGDPDTESAELQYKENGDSADEWRKVP